ncbi:LTA synthase family protein [Pseudalkalibacillus salsuginis]|uniref:LTA synthase family protein n=1 Tax=Pseudalkalibacillus salsuginis TaxID=2910972 RepID=UPI001F1E9440|nr:LTA synthase family protein [Pseudalkalibacillus salsuginis]MCF6409377.1 LTA synthase family protein [Pseudalkalibacillus salsuginis]
MIQMNKNWKDFFNKPYAFFFVAVILFWLKTYVVYQIEFELEIKNALQSFLLLINPISSALFFFGIALLTAGKKRVSAILLINFLLSFLLYANVAYYRFFNDFITLPTVLHTNSAGELGDSALALMKFTDVLYFTDTFLLIGLVLFKIIGHQPPISRKKAGLVFVSAILIFSTNLGLAETDRPQLLTRSFDRNYLVKYIGQYNYQIYDAIVTAKSSTQRAMASSDDLSEAKEFIEANQTRPNEEYFGAAKDMNVIYISLESLQTFVIGEEVNGQEVTPFLNQLTNDPNTFYFDNFFHQVGQGKTSDAEFMIANSLFPLPSGAVSMEKAQNTYQAQPAILKQHGYTTSSFHGNTKTFWNRDHIYKAYGIEKFFDSAYYDMNEEDVINYGLKDKPFFKESIPYLENLEQPFHAKMITLSNHFPFKMDEGDVDFPTPETEDEVVNGYFQTAHYTDQAVEQFFNDLKESGLYENTIVVMYGDHYGISTNHNKAMEQVLGEPITPYKNAQLQRVPLYIHIPGVKGKQVHEYGGQVDVRPTVLHLLGIEDEPFLSFGSDLLSSEHREIVPFRNGDVMTPEYSSINDKCYENPTGQAVKNKFCKDADEFGRRELELSDNIVYSDLLRFYKPKGFNPVDPSDYDYSKDQTQ